MQTTTMPNLLGFQIADAQGQIIQGSKADPSGYESFEILTAELGAEVLTDIGPGFLLAPIFDGAVEKHAIAE